MTVLDFSAGASLGVFFAAAPKYRKNCTDEKMKSLVNRLFLVLAFPQALKSPFCACVLAARRLKQHGAGQERQAGRRRPAFSVCRIFYCRGTQRGLDGLFHTAEKK